MVHQLPVGRGPGHGVRARRGGGVDHRGQGAAGAAAAAGSRHGDEKKTPGLTEAFDALWRQTRPAFDQERTWLRARTLALSALVGLGRRTVTGMLTASAQQGLDWSAAYRLFAQERFEGEGLFAPALRAVLCGAGRAGAAGGADG